jgi:hypothetical protein
MADYTPTADRYPDAQSIVQGLYCQSANILEKYFLLNSYDKATIGANVYT